LPPDLPLISPPTLEILDPPLITLDT